MGSDIAVSSAVCGGDSPEEDTGETADRPTAFYIAVGDAVVEGIAKGAADKAANAAFFGADADISSAVFKNSPSGITDQTAGSSFAGITFVGHCSVFHGAVSDPGAGIGDVTDQRTGCSVLTATFDINVLQVEIYDGVVQFSRGRSIGNVAEKAGVVGQAVFCGLNGFVHIQTGDGVILSVKVTMESVE